MMTVSDLTTIQPLIRLAHKLIDQAIAQGKLPKRGEHMKPQESQKRKEVPFVQPVFISSLWAMRAVPLPEVRTIWAHGQGLQVRQFLGLAGYYRRFIEGFSKIAQSLTSLTHKDKKFDWGEKQGAAFKLLKQKPCTTPILSLPEGCDDFVVHEKNYTTLDLELGAVVVHNVFHILNLKKCLSDEMLVIPLEEIQIGEQLNFVEEPVEIMDRETKKLKLNKIPIVKVRWNSRRGPEFTWEREDQMKQKYPHLFAEQTNTGNTS
ncbi:hypothetical protein E3N88_14134 [Mikania micrantha]|uniref:Reverse transcriptase/retrotransposon-derived protein RNase H-like domain-containing protein n=1 Tax=Mikania micrantha TaxID=192012 RepID=A0A5N6P0M1_9ASTR|nr:hypothetical protein E3N88_14134 [Mikania micrantha]